MRTHARSLSALASALLLAASAVVILGCSNPKDLNKAPCRQAHTVIVTYEPGPPPTASMRGEDKKLKISLSNKDFVEWVSPDGIVHVEGWTPDLPFDSPPKHDKKVLRSGSAKKTGSFEYKAKLCLWNDPDCTSPIRIDPIIEVME